ncbi:hypothetical protein STXM2123_12 [Streptomyces sp. F-3]|nr:hypothetical protein STXM2123_12 [Streptomyces sp. F-3]
MSARRPLGTGRVRMWQPTDRAERLFTGLHRTRCGLGAAGCGLRPAPVRSRFGARPQFVRGPGRRRTPRTPPDVPGRGGAVCAGRGGRSPRTGGREPPAPAARPARHRTGRH